MALSEKFDILMPLKRIWYRRFFRWLDRHVPPAKRHQLTRHNLYIFPSRAGYVFLALVVVLWLLGTNYQNNLILALSFLMAALFVVSILQTYFNMLGLIITYDGLEPTFAGEDGFFVFSIESSRKTSIENLEIRWQAGTQAIHEVGCARGEKVMVKVPYPTSRRGAIHPGRLYLRTYYPLGLLRCWTWLNWDIEALVYPKPHKYPQGPSDGGTKEGDSLYLVKGGDDFYGLKDYAPGDALHRVAWKNYAREQGLKVKEYSQALSRERWLDFSCLIAPDTEGKLSGLCYWVLEFSKSETIYGLKLPNREFDPNKGEAHAYEILNALAQYDD